MIYTTVILLVVSLVFNYFFFRLIGQQAIKLDQLSYELFSIKVQLDLERVKHSQEQNEDSVLEKIFQ
jgi:hypothetical protein